MCKKITLLIAIALVLGAPAAYPLDVVGSGSGYLVHTFSNANYSDVAEVLSASFTLNTSYNTNSVTRGFEILATYNYSQSGMYGTDPHPGVLDWGQFTTTQNGTGTRAYNDLAYETVYPGPYQPGPGKVHADSAVDFAAGTAHIYNYNAAAGEMVMSHEVGSPTLSNGYYNYASSWTPGTNAVVKMETTATFGVNTLINGHGAYSPANLNTDFQNADGLTMVSPLNGGTTFFNGANIDFTGNGYTFNFAGVKGAGFNFDITN
jgi:hypothetical protein